MVLIDGMAGVCLWSGDLTGSGGLIGVALLKVPDEVVIQYVSGREPGSLLAVSLPYHQVLETPPSLMGLQESLDPGPVAAVDEGLDGGIGSLSL